MNENFRFSSLFHFLNEIFAKRLNENSETLDGINDKLLLEISFLIHLKNIALTILFQLS